MEEKFNDVKKMDDLIGMGADAVVEFYNALQDQIEQCLIEQTDVKDKYGLTVGALTNYIYQTGKYHKQGKYFLAGTKRKVNRKKRSKDSNKILSEEEIKQIRAILEKNKISERSKQNEDLVGGEKTSKQCIYFVDEVEEKFKSYCDTHKRLNKSEHVMMAILEYMERYK